MHGLEDNFANIILLDWHFYLPQAVGQWDMLSAEHNCALSVNILPENQGPLLQIRCNFIPCMDK